MPRRVFEPASAFDALQLRAHAAGVGPHVSDDLPVREVVFLQPGAGGRGLREMAVECLGLYDGAWAQSAHRIALRWRSDDPRADISTPAAVAYGAGGDGNAHFNDVDDGQLLRFGLDHRAQLAQTHRMLALQDQWGRASHAGGPPMYDRLRLTGVRAPAEPVPDLASYSAVTRTRLASEFAACMTAMRLDLVLEASTARGRAHVRDMSVSGAGAWLRARPQQEGEDRGRFTHFPVGGARLEHRATLLLRPPGTGHRCHGCGRDGWSTYAHLGACRIGLATAVLHHPVKMLLLDMLRSVFPGSCVLDGDARQPMGQQMAPGGGAWWRWYSAVKRPDIVVINYPRVGVHTIIDVKTFDAAGFSHVRNDHTDFHALGAHREAERSLLSEYVTVRDRDGRVTEVYTRARAIGQNRLVCAAVSRQGALGEQLVGLMTALAGMHAQRARDGHTGSYSFMEVWRHRLSLCVHTQAARRMLTLMSEEEAVGEAPVASPDQGLLPHE